MNDKIIIKGAKTHNLKNVSLEIPRNKLVVFTGLSGSGKSSLAFDTLYAEGQRRYVESLSSYARQFLGQMEKPDVESIEGLSPAISIDQKTTNNNPRSTVGTVTEIHDYLRLLYARIGVAHCPKCHKEINKQSVDQMVEAVFKMPEGTKILVLAPVIRGKKGEHVKIFEDALKNGYIRAKVDGEIIELGEDIRLEKNIKHNISVVVDRLIVREDIRSRLTDSIESALKLANGLMIIDRLDLNEETLFSENYACPDCNINIEALEPRLFSFNSPFGACPECTGLGATMRVAPHLIIQDENLSINQGAIKVSGWFITGTDTMNHMYYEGLSNHYGFSLDIPFKDLDKKYQDIILYGTNGEEVEFNITTSRHSRRFKQAFEGIIPQIERRFRDTQSEGVKRDLAQYMTQSLCVACSGKRYRPEALAVTVNGKNIHELSELSIKDARVFLQTLILSKKDELIALRILKEINTRLAFLENVGLDYLTLSRSASTLSGGEAQRIRLATQIGAGLMGVLYILDEPSIGLHQRDNEKLLNSLKGLRDLGNTLIVVEHDEDTIHQADFVVDIGKYAGEKGGNIVCTGTPEQIMACPDSITGAYLSGKEKIDIPTIRRTPSGFITVKNARANNLKNVTVDFPLGVLCAVTGVSGSGKSSLVNEVLYTTLAKKLNRAHFPDAKCDDVLGLEQLDKVIVIDQSPIGRTPRSNPATYTGVFDHIRNLFAQTQDAKMRGYNSGRFSFNVKGGRCESCQGDGIIKIAMHFMPDIYVPCEVCNGQRYSKETLEVRYKGKNIYDVLNMTVEEALQFFENLPQIQRKIQLLYDVGLGYIKLGQPSTMLSGGEAQRVKLATELSKRPTGKTVYILDEPTTGLHTHDVKQLIGILDRLTKGGNSVIVIEHNLDVIKVADYIIDMGPEGGDMGGTVIAKGTPEEIAKNSKSYTGKFIKKVLEK
ncbi:MAG: excinuclease ABC subunit UvrA [Clostridiales bacterium]|nr:excinuclease ABC subunit UvrA [Clostridiales bacterium]